MNEISCYYFEWEIFSRNLGLLHANNKGADQPAPPHSLISAVVIRSLERILTKFAPCKVSIVSVAHRGSPAG